MSAALDGFNVTIDSLGLPAAEAVAAKAAAETLYVRAIDEAALHIKKHVQAARTTGAITVQQFNAMNNVLGRVIAESDLLTLEFAKALP